MRPKVQAEIDQAEEIASLPGGAVMAEIYNCLKMQWFRKLDRIIAALIRSRRQQTDHEGVSGVTQRQRKVVLELQDQRPRLEQLIEDYQPGFLEYRLAEDLLDALDEYEGAEPIAEKPPE